MQQAIDNAQFSTYIFVYNSLISQINHKDCAELTNYISKNVQYAVIFSTKMHDEPLAAYNG